MGLYRAMFGKVNYEQVVDPGMERRVRMRSESRIGELESLGFRQHCCYTESFAAGRLIFLLPVLVVLSLLWEGEIIRLRDGRIHTHVMLLVSGNDATYAPVFALGVMFYTNFFDGTFLVTMNGNAAIPDIHRPTMLKRYRKGRVADAWADHKSAIQSMEVAGKHAVGEADFQSFAAMVRREADL